MDMTSGTPAWQIVLVLPSLRIKALPVRLEAFPAGQGEPPAPIPIHWRYDGHAQDSPVPGGHLTLGSPWLFSRTFDGNSPQDSCPTAEEEPDDPANATGGDMPPLRSNAITELWQSNRLDTMPFMTLDDLKQWTEGTTDIPFGRIKIDIHRPMAELSRIDRFLPFYTQAFPEIRRNLPEVWGEFARFLLDIIDQVWQPMIQDDPPPWWTSSGLEAEEWQRFMDPCTRELTLHASLEAFFESQADEQNQPGGSAIPIGPEPRDSHASKIFVFSAEKNKYFVGHISAFSISLPIPAIAIIVGKWHQKAEENPFEGWQFATANAACPDDTKGSFIKHVPLPVDVDLWRLAAHASRKLLTAQSWALVRQNSKGDWKEAMKQFVITHRECQISAHIRLPGYNAPTRTQQSNWPQYAGNDMLKTLLAKDHRRDHTTDNRVKPHQLTWRGTLPGASSNTQERRDQKMPPTVRHLLGALPDIVADIQADPPRLGSEEIVRSIRQTFNADFFDLRIIENWDKDLVPNVIIRSAPGERYQHARNSSQPRPPPPGAAWVPRLPPASRVVPKPPPRPPQPPPSVRREPQPHEREHPDSPRAVRPRRH